jgi:hypothetical protein
MNNLNPESDENSSDVRAALIIAHPGHELGVYGWVKRTRPRVFVLTDGSGHSGIPRIERTDNILTNLRAEQGLLFGRFTDKEIYEAFLSYRLEFFVSLAETLAVELVNQNINFIAGDASEGYNPSHDVCRLLINAAIEIAENKTGKEIRNFDYPIVGRPEPGCPREGMCIRLDDDSFAEKLAAARQYFELKDEVEDLLETNSAEAFRSEYLYRINRREHDGPSADTSRFYEAYGEQRVKQGYYKEVIRYETHLLPVAAKLRERSRE